MNLFRRIEVNRVDLVDDVTQEVTVDHSIHGPFEHYCYHISSVAAVGPLESTKVGKQPLPFLTIGSPCFFVVDERNQLVACDTVFAGRPISPSVRLLNRRLESLSFEF